MGRENAKEFIPFNMSEKPCKQYPFLMPLIWGGSYLLTRPFGLKIRKVNMEQIKPPYLVIGTHQGPADYYIGPLAMFPHRAMYVSDMEGFAAFGKWLYRGLGCIGKRRYVSDVSVVRNMKYALSLGQSVVMYPESRHSNVGVTAYIPSNMGKLAKMMKVPLVILSAKGSYLANPFWDEEHTRKVPMEVRMECLYTKEELENTSEKEIQDRIETALQYDEYRYQQERGIKITDEKRAEGIHKPLYQCRACGEKYGMDSKGESLMCQKCGAVYRLTEDGFLENPKGERIHIPDWYEWEREQATKTFDDKHFTVRIEALPNEKGFVGLGEGKLTMDREEFRLEWGKECLHFPHAVRESVQTEYNYKGKGMCIVLSTKDCCYYLYSEDEDFQPTELQFLGEALFREATDKKNRK